MIWRTASWVSLVYTQAAQMNKEVIRKIWTVQALRFVTRPKQAVLSAMKNGSFVISDHRGIVFSTMGDRSRQCCAFSER